VIAAVLRSRGVSCAAFFASPIAVENKSDAGLAVPMLVRATYPAAMIRQVHANNAIPALAVMAVNVIYFKKRWKLLNSGRRPPAATP
jgi:hypothetical protein